MNVNKSLITNYLLLLFVSLIWGSQFFLNKVALQSFTPSEIALLRAFIGVLTLTVFIKLFPKLNQVNIANFKAMEFQKKAFMVGLFEATVPLLLIAWGQQYIDSAIASILISTIPIFTITIMLFLPREKVTTGNIASVIIGFVAILILLSPDINLSAMSSNFIGMLAVLAGAFSFSVSLIMVKQLPPVPAVFAARSILFWASIQMLPFVLWQASFNIFRPDILSLFAVIALGVFCAGIVYVLFIMLITRAGPAVASFSNYLVPAVGIVLGVLVFQEHLSLMAMLALVLIFISLLVNELFSPKKETNS